MIIYKILKNIPCCSIYNSITQKHLYFDSILKSWTVSQVIDEDKDIEYDMKTGKLNEVIDYFLTKEERKEMNR